MATNKTNKVDDVERNRYQYRLRPA